MVSKNTPKGFHNFLGEAINLVMQREDQEICVASLSYPIRISCSSKVNQIKNSSSNDSILNQKFEKKKKILHSLRLV